MTLTTFATPAVGAGKTTAALILFCASASAEPAALANILARSGIRLIVRPHALAEHDSPTADQVQQMRRQMEECAPALVLASCPWHLALTALTASRQAGRPFIYRIDQALGDDETELDRHATVAQAADLVLVRGADQQAALVACGVAPEKLVLAADAQVQADSLLDFVRLH